MSETIRLLNRWPHTERGFCFRCGEWYSLTQLRLPAVDGVALTSMAHPPGLIEEIADAIYDGRLRFERPAAAEAQNLGEGLPACPSCGGKTRMDEPYLMCDSCQKVVGAINPTLVI